MIPKLYGYWRSSASWRIRWAFELKKIPFDYIPVNILKDEHKSAAHLARNPMGTLPVLEPLPGNFLSQSMAIMLWMEENFSREPYLFGWDRSQRYKIIELCEIINCDTGPLQTPRAQKRHSDDPVKKAEWARDFIRQGLNAFEKNIHRSAGTFSIGNQVSAADLFLIPQMYNARRFEISFDDYPTLKRVWESAINTVECQKTSPEKQTDAT